MLFKVVSNECRREESRGCAEGVPPCLLLCGIVYSAAVFCVENLQVIAVLHKVWS